MASGSFFGMNLPKEPFSRLIFLFSDPVGMAGGNAVAVSASIGVSAEVVSLRLEQVGGKTFAAVTVVVG